MIEKITTKFENEKITIKYSSLGHYIVYFRPNKTRTIYIGSIWGIDLETLKNNLIRFADFFNNVYNKGIEDGIEDGKTQIQDELKNMLGIKGE